MRLNYDPAVSLGNLLSIGTIIIGLSVGYATIKTEQEGQTKRLDQIDTSARENALTRTSLDARIRAVEIMQASQTSDLRNILTVLTRIERQFDEERQRP